MKITPSRSIPAFLMLNEIVKNITRLNSRAYHGSTSFSLSYRSIGFGVKFYRGTSVVTIYLTIDGQSLIWDFYVNALCHYDLDIRILESSWTIFKFRYRIDPEMDIAQTIKNIETNGIMPILQNGKFPVSADGDYNMIWLPAYSDRSFDWINIDTLDLEEFNSIMVNISRWTKKLNPLYMEEVLHKWKETKDAYVEH